MNSDQVDLKKFEELTKSELYAILALRLQVFCVEQNCPYQDIDNEDQTALHVFLKDKNTIKAYARIIKENKKKYHIGRVVVNEKYRKDGLATAIINKCIESINHNKNATIEISAQSYLKDFYTKFGFINTGHYYLEDNIPHERMQLTA